MIKNLETHKADLEYEVEKLNKALTTGKISKIEADHIAGTNQCRNQEDGRKNT